jgi:glucosamine--fructose-6-phosphate aminotransferase (isomerizing)
MTDVMTHGYEQDMLDQPEALEAFAAHPLPDALAALDPTRFDRIVLTGMGSSDYATIPLELLLTRQGLPVWRIQTGRLLETPELITGRTLLWITSQSGRSGEVVALIDSVRRSEGTVIVATTNDAASPVARAADHVVLLRSGSEATVSSKSYLNTLASFHRIAARLSGWSDAEAVAEIMAVAASLRLRLAEPGSAVAALAARALEGPMPRLALVGGGADATTALTGALILKEASKVAAEGYVGGAYRHGPMETAGRGATLLLFGTGADEDVTLKQLATDLSGTGTLVVSVSPQAYAGAEHIAVPNTTALERLAHAMVVVQQLSLGLARGSGLVPGEFLYGKKITSQV